MAWIYVRHWRCGVVNISKIFFFDFFNIRKIKRIIFLLVLLPVLFSLILKDVTFTTNYAGLTGITIAFASTVYTLSSYATMDKLKLYMSLPISSKNFIWGLIVALYIDTLLEKLSFFIIATFFIYSNPINIILSALVTTFICVVAIVALLLTMNAQKWNVFIINIFAMVGIVFASIILSNSLLYWILVNICLMIIPITTLMIFDSVNLVINHQLKKHLSFTFLNKNYFALTMIMEKIFVVNTLFIIVIIISFLAMMPHFSVIVNLAWCLGAINTPAMTMLSGDKSISKQADMLPDLKKSLIIMYLKFLTGYFLLINMIILVFVGLKERNFTVMNVAIAVIVTMIEVVTTTMLEKKMRLTNWQIRKELWRHPRKYIVPIIVFTVTTVVSLVLA